MKRILLLCAAAMLMLSPFAFGQAPQAVNYQAVARDASGNLLVNKTISLRLSVLSGSSSGTTVYAETHSNVSTNAYGLFSLQLGTGSTSNSFANINWSSANHFLKVEMDVNNGTSYSFIGASSMVSVPYALFAEKAGNVNMKDTSATNETITNLSYNSSTGELSITEAGVTRKVTIPSGSGGSSPWTTSGNDIYYTKGRVGIGTSAPAFPFHVTGNVTSSNNVLSRFIAKTNVTSSPSAGHSVVNYGNTSFTSDIFGGIFRSYSYSTSFNIGIQGEADSSNITNRGVQGIARGKRTSVNNVGVSGFATGAAGSTSTSPSQNYGLFGLADSAGINVGVLGRAGTNTSNANYAGYFIGDVTYTGSLSGPSDVRLKKDIQDMPSVLSSLRKLSMKQYYYRTEEFKGMNLPKEQQYGFIAQDLEKEFPFLVKEQKHALPLDDKFTAADSKSANKFYAYKGVNYIGMIPILTQAIKEQQDIIDSQATQIQDLQKRLEALEQKVK